MTFAENMQAAAEEVVAAVRQYAEIAVNVDVDDSDVDGAWTLFAQAVDELGRASPDQLTRIAVGTAPVSPRQNPVIWIDVGYAVEIRDHRRAAAVAYSRVAHDKGVLPEQGERVLEVDPVALVDFLETVDGWDIEQYGSGVVSLVTMTRSIRALTKHEATELGEKLDSGAAVTHRPD